MPAGAAAASPDAIRVEAYGKAPLEHFGIGEPRIRHVRLDHARAVEVRPRAGTAGDRLVVLVALVAEGEIVHRALRGGERAQRAVERVGDCLRSLDIARDDRGRVTGLQHRAFGNRDLERL